MDSFSEPYTRQGDDISLDAVRADIRSLEQQLRDSNIPLSGRVLHICHYLPVTATLNTRAGVLSPPPTPPITPADASADPSPKSDTPIWTLAPRYGHAAMISGIQSLSTTHEQLIIGWTGDILSPTQNEHISTDTVGLKDRAALDEALAAYQPKESDPDDDRKITYVPVWLDDKVAHGHYDGYCKQTLWPLFHYLLWQDVATEYASADSHYPYYESANAAFARKIAEVYRPGDLIWVHDYHLLLLPRLVREAIPDVVLGLFVHTPFPSSEIFRCLPRRKEILDGMLGANLICFQTYSYSRHFTSTCVRVCGYETTPRGIDVEGHVTSVMHCPVGVDAERVGRDIKRPGIQPKLEALRTLYEGKKIIVGRDKLDIVKGVLQKLRAFEKLLQDYPEWIGNVVMIQVTSPALTDSPKLERIVSELVAHINGEYGSLDFIPVHHYHQTLKKDEFYALLSVADLAVITPLRDGMNTTSMEFVIAQGEQGKNSPLVLSEFMGISKHMDDALLVNPWNLGDVAAAINRGLLMSPAEKAQRQAKLYKVVTTHTSHTWAAVLVKMLLGLVDGQGQARMTPYIPKEELCAAYERAGREGGRRLFLFDYDGTLAPIVKTPSMAIPSPSTLEALERLSADPRNLVYIISGRDGAFLEQHLGHLKNVGFRCALPSCPRSLTPPFLPAHAAFRDARLTRFGLVCSAEHGGFVRMPGSTEWVNFTENLDMEWMGEVAEIFRYYTERTTGSHIETKKSSITWHYRGSDPEWGQFQCRQCQDLLENNLAHKRPIEVLVGKKNLEVRPIAVNKGEIVKRILYQNPDAQFVFCAGDDKTDEDMFRALLLFPPGTTEVTMPAPLSVTLVDGQDAPPVKLAIRPDAVFTTAVGHSSKRTLASWHVTTPQEVVDHMLELVNGCKSNL
ncbi:putative trehalose-phosphatase [Lyophyllum shimeji]|uniref:Trehalose-phosphatase n=1 Tax=Lyophyllum shimeji TaxID=47721 RepID=A0A9P3PSY2_LYOSH|nr:putative trehalose-phosphatase [Lyophyllum shimeji]